MKEIKLGEWKHSLLGVKYYLIQTYRCNTARNVKTVPADTKSLQLSGGYIQNYVYDY
jgi:hypothetical protein